MTDTRLLSCTASSRPGHPLTAAWKKVLYPLAVLLMLLQLAACSGAGTMTRDGYDRKQFTFKFSQPTRKLSLGLVYCGDSRKEKVDYLFDGRKPLLRFVTQLEEDMLVKQGGFSSVTVITSHDLPVRDGGAIDVEKLKKAHGFDYILISDITEAELKKVQLPSSFSYKFSTYFNMGVWPEPYEYRSQVRLHGKLISVADGSTAWEGDGSSRVRQMKLQNSQDVLLTALYNSVGGMLADMSKIFSLQIKEVQ